MMPRSLETEVVGMSIEVARLYYGHLDGLPWGRVTLHGYVLKDPRWGAVLVDTGLGGPLDDLRDLGTFPRKVDDALADHGLSVADVTAVVTTHLHQDHFGHNVVFKHLPFHVQRTELERAREEQAHLAEWFDFAGARFELLEGDAEVMPGVRAIATPGHTTGHQSLIVESADGPQLLVGDAVFNREIWEGLGSFSDEHPAWGAQIMSGDADAWRDSAARLARVDARVIHFCHDAYIAHPGNGNVDVSQHVR